MLGLERPGFVLVGKLLWCLMPALAHRRTRCEALPAVAVHRADSIEGIARPVVWDADVADLRMDQPVPWLAIDQQARADAGPHRQVTERGGALSGAPPVLAEGGRIDVVVEHHRYAD